MSSSAAGPHFHGTPVIIRAKSSGGGCRECGLVRRRAWERGQSNRDLGGRGHLGKKHT